MINGMIAFEAKENHHDPRDRVVELEEALNRAYRMIGGLESRVTELTEKLRKSEELVSAQSLDIWALNR